MALRARSSWSEPVLGSGRSAGYARFCGPTRREMLPGMTGILTETARTVPISFRDDQQQRDPANLTVRLGDRVGNRDSLSLPR